MSAQKQREIASKGGRVAHEKGAAHEWTVDEARVAGRKGGCARHGHRDVSVSNGLELNQVVQEGHEPMETTRRWPVA